MQSLKYLAALAPLAAAYTKPTTATWGPLLLPDLEHSVTAGETFEVKWDPAGKPTNGVTVSLVLCQGSSANCVPSDTAIVEGLAASAKSYSWAVPSNLTPGTQSTATGYGMLIIVDGTGEFQYSTQFSVLKGKGGGGSSSSSSSSSSATATGGGKSSSSKTGTTHSPTETWTDVEEEVGEEEEEDDYDFDFDDSMDSTTSSLSEATTTAEVGTSTEVATVTAPKSTADQTSPTPAVRTQGSGATRNAAGLLLGAVAAVFML